MRKYLSVFIIFIFIIICAFFVSDRTNKKLKTITYNGSRLTISIDGEISNTLPTDGSYYLASYDCNNTNTKIVWDKNNSSLNVSNGINNGGVACYLEFKSNPLLSEMPSGGYVAYTGNNGCDDSNSVNGYTSCSGKNANYESDNNMGYCVSTDIKFLANGWRIAYVDDGNVFLTSSGAPECLCTSSDGKASDSSCNGSLTNAELNKHFSNIDFIALKYCNSNFSENGKCNTDTASGIEQVDLNEIVNMDVNLKNGNVMLNSKVLTNNLIDNGGDYWFSIPYNITNSNLIYAYGYDKERTLSIINSGVLHGVRPVLKLDSSVIVTGGSGTYTDPYTIDNNYFNVNSDDLSSVELSLNSIEDDVTMCISLNTSVCTEYVEFSDNYTLDLSEQEDGETIIYVYYKNSDGKLVASMSRSVILDTTPPVINSFSISSGTQLNRTLNISCTGASYMCFSNDSSDVNNCTNWLDYASTHTWVLSSGIGSKTVYAFFKDEAGNISTTSAITSVSNNTSEY